MSTTLRLHVSRRFRDCFVVLLLAMSVGPAFSQSLDEAVRRQLNNDCALLSNGNTDDLGPDLFTICTASFTAAGSAANSGGGGASSQTMTASVENRRKARLEESRSPELVRQWGVYLNAHGEKLNRERTRFADGFDSNVIGATLGGDLRIGQKWVAGLAFDYRKHSGDFEAAGDFETSSIGGTVYTSFLPAENAFIDVALSYTDKSHEVHRFAHFFELGTGVSNFRNYQGILDSETDGAEQSAQLLFGYDFSPGRWTVGPRLGGAWSRTEVDGYAESGGGAPIAVGSVRNARGLALIYEDQETTSLQGKLGVQASLPISTGFGVVMLQGNADYLHEFDNDQRFVNVRFVQDLRANPRVFQYQTDEPARDFFKIGFSAVFVLQGGIQPFLNVQAMLGNEQFDSYAATLGVRWEL